MRGGCSCMCSFLSLSLSHIETLRLVSCVVFCLSQSHGGDLWDRRQAGRERCSDDSASRRAAQSHADAGSSSARMGHTGAMPTANHLRRHCARRTHLCRDVAVLFKLLDEAAVVCAQQVGQVVTHVVQAGHARGVLVAPLQQQRAADRQKRAAPRRMRAAPPLRHWPCAAAGGGSIAGRASAAATAARAHECALQAAAAARRASRPAGRQALCASRRDAAFHVRKRVDRRRELLLLSLALRGAAAARAGQAAMTMAVFNSVWHRTCGVARRHCARFEHAFGCTWRRWRCSPPHLIDASTSLPA
eukprot:360672-Chlamydomonas_euryale.AAC.2